MKQFQFIGGKFIERQRISEIDYAYRIYVPEDEVLAEIEKVRKEGVSIGHAMRNKTEIDAARAAEREAILDIVRQWNCGMLKDKSLYDAIESRGEQKPVGASWCEDGKHYYFPVDQKPVRIEHLLDYEKLHLPLSEVQRQKINEIIDAVNTLMEKQA